MSIFSDKNMFGNIFKSKKVKELIEKKEILLEKIERVQNEIRKKDALLKCKNDLINKKEFLDKKESNENWSEMEEALKKFHSENLELRKNIREKGSFLDLSFLKYTYLVPLEKMFPEIRFKNFISTMNMSIQEFSVEYLESLDIEEKIKKEIENRVLKYHNDIMSWEVKTYLIKGEKLSKLYQKTRKLVNIFSDNYLEYVGDLHNFNFYSLKKYGYKEKEIEEFKKVYLEYLEKNRITA